VVTIQDVVKATTEVAPASPRVGKSVGAGLLGVGICALCLLPPIFHWVLGPLGPGIAGFFAAARIKADSREASIIALTLGVGVSLVVSGVVYVATSVTGNARTPPLVFLGVGVVVLLYASLLGWLGAWFARGGGSSPRDAAPGGDPVA
jgi:hypothetical protein